MLPFMVRLAAVPSPALGPYLDRLAHEYGPRYLHTDPVGEVRRFDTPADREIAAYLAAGLAFGRVDTILAHLRELWDRLEGAPARIAEEPASRRRRRLRGFVHRWVRGEDVALVLGALGSARRRHGSLRELFLRGYDAEAADLGGALGHFLPALREGIRGGGRPVPLARLSHGARTFFPDPERGGAMKRVNLFLRWMVRADDGVDLGLWNPVQPRQLVIPLDTHVSRISRYLGLTSRRTVDWKMAVEVTGNLRTLDGEDPVRFDFALSRLGILDMCPRQVDVHCCRACPLVTVCTLGRGESRA